MDCSYVVSRENVSWRYPVVKAWVEGRPVRATLDSGCAQSLVRGDLVQSHGQRTAHPVRVACLHGDTKQIECQWVHLRVMEHQGELLVGVVPQLVCEMLLGLDWTPVYNVLDRVRDTEVARKKIHYREGWLGEIEENEGSADETDELDLSNFTSSLLF
ncbi:hypothetical protein Y1Q_0020018 [Alligator mississippiensis]|uniref:Peptidase A2 domain-containing protein n=1 Tax=Alligator mississippiensis TaxID=8496 RepID=A0A151LYS2_ALLMI|nr:hypothetical protein Y1Q_0020018 [Alligator mississippiensis]